MNYKIKEYNTVINKGICGYSCLSDSTSNYLDKIDYQTPAAFQILLEAMKNCVINKVYLKIKPTSITNYALYAKKH